MSDLEAWLIIILVIGVIASNLAVLKYSAKYKMPQFGKDGKIKQPTKSHSDKKLKPDTEEDVDVANDDSDNNASKH